MATLSRILRLIIQYRQIGWVALALGMALRIGLLLAVWEKPLIGDSAQYMEEALFYYSDYLPDQEPYWPPLLPLWIALWGKLLGFGDMVARTSMLLWYVGLHFSLFRLAHKVGGHWAAAISVLAVAVYPEFVMQSVEPMSYLPAAALLCILLLWLWKALHQNQTIWWVLSGLAMGSLVLLRPSTFLIIGVLGILLLGPRFQYWKKAGIWVLASLVIPLAWMGHMHGKYGYGLWMNRANSYNFFLGNNAWTPSYKTWYWGSHWNPDPDFQALVEEGRQMPGPRADSHFRNLALEHIAQNPLTFAIRTASRARIFWAFDLTASAVLLHYFESPWASYGWFGFGATIWMTLLLSFCWTKAPPKNETSFFRLLVNGAIAAWIIPYLLAFSHPSFHLPILPILFVLAASRVWVSPIQFARSSQWLLPITGTIALLAIQLEWILRVLLPNT